MAVANPVHKLSQIEKLRAAQSQLRDQQILWLNRNRGVLTEIARICGVGLSWVRLVLYDGKPSLNNKVEIELAKRGAPGFEKFQTPARKSA